MLGFIGLIGEISAVMLQNLIVRDSRSGQMGEPDKFVVMLFSASRIGLQRTSTTSKAIQLSRQLKPNFSVTASRIRVAVGGKLRLSGAPLRGIDRRSFMQERRT